MGVSRAEWDIDLVGLGRVPVRVSTAPMPSALHLAQCAFTPRDTCIPPSLARQVRQAVTPEAAVLLSTMAHIGRTVLPDSLTPSNPDLGPRDWADAVLAGADLLEEQVLSDSAGQVPARWRAAVRSPHDWTRRYVAACLQVRKLLDADLASAAARLDRETTRIGTASVRGAVPELLNSLFTRSRLAGKALRVSARAGKRLRLAENVTLVPVLTGPQFRAHHFAKDVVTHLVYPLPPPARSSGADDGKGLAALLGPQRVRLLLAISTPRSAGWLAGLLNWVPSGLTHHVDALVAAGLARRHRRGRQVLIERTERGSALLDLYAA